METFAALVLNGLILGSIYAGASLGLTLTFGVVKVVNFAHGELIMVSMYGAYLMYEVVGWNIYASAFVVVPVVFVAGAALQQFVLQPLIDSEELQVFATFGMLILLQALALMITRGEFLNVDTALARERVSVLGVATTWPRLIFIPAALCMTAAVYVFLKRTWIGRAMRAVAMDRPAARLMGINVEFTYILASALAAATAAVTGVLAAPLYIVTPQVGGAFIFAAFAVVVLGGLGSIPGALVGGIVIGITETMSGYYLDPALKRHIWFGLLIAALLVRPYGIFSGKEGGASMTAPVPAESS